MKRGWWLLFLASACTGPEDDDEVASSGDADPIAAAREVFAGCVSETFQDGEVIYTTTWDDYGWEVSADDGAGDFGTTTVYEREGDLVVRSLTVSDDGDTSEKTYDPHQHVQKTVDVYNDGAGTQTIIYDLEHDGDRLRASESPSVRETLDACENPLRMVNEADEVLFEAAWEYERDCLPSTGVLDLPGLGFVQTAHYEGGRPVRYVFTGDLEAVNDVVWDCP